MSGARALEARVRAWRTFREVAHATRSLAAAQALRWAAAREHAVRHGLRARDLARRIGRRRGDPAAPCLLLALGTDLGLCGRLNVAVAARVRDVARELSVAQAVVVGVRLGDLVAGELGARTVTTPTTVEGAVSLADELAAAALEAPARAPLVIVSAVETTPAGAPRVRVAREEGQRRALEEASALRRSAVLGRPRAHAPWAERADLQARVAEALLTASLVEAQVRLATTTRAHEVAERRVTEQERALAKARQEGVTQELLEVLAGRSREDPEAGRAEAGRAEDGP